MMIWYIVLAVIAIAAFAELIRVWRDRKRFPGLHSFTAPTDPDEPFIAYRGVTFPNEPDPFTMPVQRVPMQSRFVPDGNSGIRRDLALADQIIADQQEVHAEPGERVHVPAPGEKGYEQPHEHVAVAVGRYTMHLQRDATTSVSEAKPDGDEWPAAPVPVEWEPIFVAYAMEVVRLREGWSVDRP